VLGHLDGKLEQTVEARVTSYTDTKSGQIIYAYHAKLGGLHPNFAYLYGAMHDGAEPEFATFRTPPRGRAPFMFTSFGDQGTPALGKKFVPPEGVRIKNPPYVNDNLGSPAAGDTTLCRDGGRALTNWGKSDAKGGVPCNEGNCFSSYCN
jgi:hypothetical protein